MEIKALVVGALRTNCYILFDRHLAEAVIVDPGDDAEYIENTLRDLGVEPTKIIATHGHFDHILSAFELQQAYNIPFLINDRDAFIVKRMRETANFFLDYDVVEPEPVMNNFIKDSEIIKIGNEKLLVMETPGHTPGGVCLYAKKGNFLLTGDTIFADGAVGRTDFSYSSAERLEESVAIILEYPGSTQLFPGHGESSTIFQEKQFHSGAARKGELNYNR